MTIQSRVRPSRSDTYWVEASKKSWRIPARPGRGMKSAFAFALRIPVRLTNPRAGRKSASISLKLRATSHRSFG